MTEATPRPCPFCGSEKIDPQGWTTLPEYSGTANERYGPCCDDCGATAETIQEWNTRAYDAERDELIGALSAFIGRVMNAQIDLSTGKTKAQVDAALTEALRDARATLAKVKAQ